MSFTRGSDYGNIKHSYSRNNYRNHQSYNNQRATDNNRSYKNTKFSKNDDGNRDVIKKGSELKITISNDDSSKVIFSRRNSITTVENDSSSRNGNLPLSETRKRFRRSTSRDRVKNYMHGVNKSYVHHKFTEHRKSSNHGYNQERPNYEKKSQSYVSGKISASRDSHIQQQKLHPEPKSQTYPRKKYYDSTKYPKYQHARDGNKPERRNIYSSDTPPNNRNIRPASHSDKHTSYSQFKHDSTKRLMQQSIRTNERRPAKRSSPRISSKKSSSKAASSRIVSPNRTPSKRDQCSSRLQHHSGRQRHNKNASSLDKSSLKDHPSANREFLKHFGPSSSSSSESSSEDEKVLRMRLLKDKYCNDSGHDEEKFLKNDRTDELDVEVFSHKQNYSSHPTRELSNRDKNKVNIIDKSSHDIQSDEDSDNHADNLSLQNGKAFHFTSDVSAMSSKVASLDGSPNFATDKYHMNPDVINNSERYSPSPPHNMILPEKRKHKRKKKWSSTSSSSTSSSSSSSSSSSNSSSSADQIVNKRSRWSSGSDNTDSKVSPRIQKLHKITSPLANKSVLRNVKAICIESMFRFRHCKFCALQLKTMDDVKRHVASERHRVVTGEWFINNVHLIRAPIQGELVRCVVCNAIIEFNRSIKEHECSNQHRQQIRRWMARNQATPPVKYYIDT